MLKTIRTYFKFSKYLDTLYQQSKALETPFFKINSQAVRIIEDPLDFYALLCVASTLPRIRSTMPLKELASPASTSRPDHSKGIC